MNTWLKKLNKHLAYAGFDNVKIKDVNKLFQTLKHETDNACIQLLDASLIAGPEHLRFATLNAVNALEDQVNISSSLAMEILLYTSAQRQIKEAVRLIGVKTSTTKVAAVILAENQQQAQMMVKGLSQLLGGKRDDSVFDLTDEKIANLKKLFGISDAELEAEVDGGGSEKQALTDLVIEHMALLVTQR